MRYSLMTDMDQGFKNCHSFIRSLAPISAFKISFYGGSEVFFKN